MSIVVEIGRVEHVPRERKLFWVFSEHFDGGHEGIVRIFGVDRNHVAIAFLLNFFKTQERNVFASIFAVIRFKIRLNVGRIVFRVARPIE